MSLALAATVVAADSTKLKIALSGANEVPPADPDGRGSAEVVIDAAAGEVCFDVKFHDTGTPNRGHIHKEAAGVNGPIVVTFFELRPGDALATDARHDEIEEGRLMRCVTGDPAVLADIVANPDAYYVNLHNTRFGGGAVRGQLDD